MQQSVKEVSDTFATLSGPLPPWLKEASEVAGRDRLKLIARQIRDSSISDSYHQSSNSLMPVLTTIAVASMAAIGIASILGVRISGPRKNERASEREVC